jgi:hypothetical protein
MTHVEYTTHFLVKHCIKLYIQANYIIILFTAILTPSSFFSS